MAKWSIKAEQRVPLSDDRMILAAIKRVEDIQDFKYRGTKDPLFHDRKTQAVIQHMVDNLGRPTSKEGLVGAVETDMRSVSDILMP